MSFAESAQCNATVRARKSTPAPTPPSYNVRRARKTMGMPNSPARTVWLKSTRRALIQSAMVTGAAADPGNTFWSASDASSAAQSGDPDAINAEITNVESSSGTAPQGKPGQPMRKFSDIKRACVAGATGGVGRAIVEQLLNEKVKVKAIVRDIEKARRILPAVPADELELVKGDVTAFQTLPDILEDCDVLLCATGPRPSLDPLGPFKVDYAGTANLVAVAKNMKGKIKKIVYVSSIGVEQTFVSLNLFWGVLFWKKRGEEEIQRSGIDYTIVRPGGLKSSVADMKNPLDLGNVVVEPGGTYGLPELGKMKGQKKFPEGPVLRSSVANLCVEALVNPETDDKVLEIVTDKNAPNRDLSDALSNLSSISV